MAFITAVTAVPLDHIAVCTGTDCSVFSTD